MDLKEEIKPLIAPLDDEGFCVSFCAADNVRIKEFFDLYGFVVVREVLNDEAIDATLEEFWNSIGGSRDDDEVLESFYARQRFATFGIIGMGPNITSVTQFRNRCNPLVHQAFAAVMGTDKLWVDHDRLGVMRPTIGRPTGEKPQWRTKERWLHLDCNPTLGAASIGSFVAKKEEKIDFEKSLIIQGLLTLTDASVQDGGFHCVPGSHRLSVQWALNNPSKFDSMQVGPADSLRLSIQKIPLRRGCLLAWNSLLFHGNHPNYSRNWRAVQYIRMLPCAGPCFRPLVENIDTFPPTLESEWTPLARKLCGFDAWDDEGK